MSQCGQRRTPSHSCDGVKVLSYASLDTLDAKGSGLVHASGADGGHEDSGDDVVVGQIDLQHQLQGVLAPIDEDATRAVSSAENVLAGPRRRQCGVVSVPHQLIVCRVKRSDELRPGNVRAGLLDQGQIDGVFLPASLLSKRSLKTANGQRNREELPSLKALNHLR
jgi:hypothetical protein